MVGCSLQVFIVDYIQTRARIFKLLGAQESIPKTGGIYSFELIPELLTSLKFGLWRAVTSKRVVIPAAHQAGNRILGLNSGCG
jgi:hypothetical protein